MREITYYVATSIDGFISRPDDDISGFVQKGDGVDKYLSDLQAFDTVIMGRKTYEFGYQFGLEPGKPAYPHMDHYIFSETLTFNDPHEQVKVCSLDLATIRNLKDQAGTDIYLCGGGMFAGWLLDHGLIDTLKVKLNPLLLGEGALLFGASTKQYKLQLTDYERFEHGLQMITYRIVY